MLPRKMPMLSHVSFTVTAITWVLHGGGFVAAQRNTEHGWTSLPVTVPERLVDFGYQYPEVQVALGTPPQAINMTIHFRSSLLAVWSNECAFCPSTTPFFPSRSSTLESEEQGWDQNSVTAQGIWHHDVVGFGGLRAEDVQFVLMKELSSSNLGSPYNGPLGIWANLTNPHQSLFQRLWDQKALLDPVIGLRLDPTRPRMTVGALDPEDYVGPINWVEVGARVGDGFLVDGIKGFDGSFIPFGDTGEIVATLQTFFRNILVPPSVLSQYFENPNYHGSDIKPELIQGSWFYPCPNAENGVFPPAQFTVTINGVDYPLDGPHNMIRVLNSDFCSIGLDNTTSSDVENLILGLPFMRSVYIAYRFPTSDSPDCPAYLGFAFPSGLGRTEEQINQVPRSAPPLSEQCLNFKNPTEEPVGNLPASDFQRGEGAYSVYGDASGKRQVPLVGAKELRKRVVQL